MSTDEPWFTAGANPAGAMRLFFFPFAGGNANSFLPWQELFGPRLELRIAQLPGRGVRLFDPPLADMDELVARLTRAVTGLADRPFAFFGHSLGALVAFEVARQLRRTGRPEPISLWVSGAESPRNRLVRRELHRLPDTELVAALADYNGTPAELLQDQELMQLVLPGLRADFALHERYVYRPEPPLDLPIHMLLSDDDPYVEHDRAADWSLETSRPVRQHVFPGDHFFLDAHRRAIATLLADTAAEEVAERTGRSWPAPEPGLTL